MAGCYLYFSLLSFLSLSLFGFPSIPFFTGRRTYGGFPPSVLYSAPAYYGRGEEFHYCILFISVWSCALHRGTDNSL